MPQTIDSLVTLTTASMPLVSNLSSISSVTTGAQLSNLNFSNANLSKVNFSGANFSGADLTGAILTGAKVPGLGGGSRRCPTRGSSLS